MTQFDNATITKAVTLYFDGKVSSRSILLADGSKKTLGLMFPGEYTFNTASSEVMEIMSGALTVQLPGNDDWQAIAAGQSFSIPANAAFSMRVTEISDYCCSYDV